MSLLERIVVNKRTEISAKKRGIPVDSFVDKLTQSDRSFLNAISKDKPINIIAEIKKASPSEGVMRQDFDVAKIAKIYDKKADAISVVTDEKFFQGSLENLNIAKKNSKLPILCKDFIVDEYQIFEARLFGADAILLIASLLTLEEINGFILIAKLLKMDVVLEIHNREEMEIALESNATIIGINNRNLEDFSIDLRKTVILSPLLKKAGKIVVSESGFSTSEEIKLASKTCNAVLVGTNLIKADDIAKQFETLKF